jgi:hypothetical protein
MKKQFAIQLKGNKYVINYFDTLADAQFKLNEYESIHEKYGYPSDFYEIAEFSNGTYKPVES